MAPARHHEPRAIVIGAGIGGIALAARLKLDLKYENFTIYEREKSIGGTWFLNTYPGVGCDVDSHLYSFSFAPNPNWSKRFAEQPEILQYLQDTADKFGIRQHVRTQIEVVEARWQDDKLAWAVTLRDISNGHIFTREAEILISCVGTISIPKDCDIPGLEKYTGKVFHSARWDHEHDIKGKKVAVIGNGCSAAQLVPFMVRDAKQVVQFQRSAQWINERPNREFTSFEKWCFKHVPLWHRFYRFWLWYSIDGLHTLYSTATEASFRQRAVATEGAVDYMKRMTPQRYHKILIPDFPLGCKRRIFDPGYLESLHNDNIELTDERVTEFTENGLRTAKREIEADTVVLSTGFKIQEFLSPIKVVGRDGMSLNNHWKNTRGAQAYKATFVTGFPNFGIIFGPNAFPAHNSVIYSNETQAEFIVKTIFTPILKGHFRAIDVKESAENRNANEVQSKLQQMVWNGGCSNWNLDRNGRNTTNYHSNTWKFWYELFWPEWKDFDTWNDSGKRPIHPLSKVGLYTVSAAAFGGLFLAASLQASIPFVSYP